MVVFVCGFGHNFFADSSPSRDARYTDVLSVALSVYKIVCGKNLFGHNCFYIVFSAYNNDYISDVMRVLRANKITGMLCYKSVLNKNNETQKMLALRVRDRNQKFMHDVQKTIDDVTYFRDTVLPEYNVAHEKKK